MEPIDELLMSLAFKHASYDFFVMAPGGIVALGKFDALHIGHRELAIQASKVGAPYLLSFIGMAEVFGWEPRYKHCSHVFVFFCNYSCVAAIVLV